MAKKEVITTRSRMDLAEKGAQLFTRLNDFYAHSTGRFSVALAGGTTPQAMYALLSEEPLRSGIDWYKIHFFFSDERFVPQTNMESNFLGIKNSLLDRILIPESNIHPVPVSKKTPEEAARKYGSEIELFFNEKTPRFDLVILGLGPDGHTASLFPNHYKQNKNENIVLSVSNSPKPPAERISFSLKLINNAKNILLMASGKEKAVVVKDILENKKSLPAGMVNPEDGNLFWLIDKEAASLLN